VWTRSNDWLESVLLEESDVSELSIESFSIDDSDSIFQSLSIVPSDRFSQSLSLEQSDRAPFAPSAVIRSIILSGSYRFGVTQQSRPPQSISATKDESSANGSGQSVSATLIGAIVAGIAVLLVVLAFILFFRRRKPMKHETEEMPEAPPLNGFSMNDAEIFLSQYQEDEVGGIGQELDGLGLFGDEAQEAGLFNQ
jgi:hypothetical protein